MYKSEGTTTSWRDFIVNDSKKTNLKVIDRNDFQYREVPVNTIKQLQNIN